MIDTLTQLGFSQVEATIFECLLKDGPCFAGHIVYETKKHRQVVYTALEKLEKRKVIVVAKKNGKKYYSVSSVTPLLTNLKQQQVLAVELSRVVENKLGKERELVETFSGQDSYKEGLKSFRTQAEIAQEYIVIGGEPKNWYDYVQPFFSTHVAEVKKLKDKGSSVSILFYESERASAEKYISPYKDNPYVCKIANDTFKIPHTTWLAGEHVYFLTPVEEPLVIHIKSRALSKQYHAYFRKVWGEANLLK